VRRRGAETVTNVRVIDSRNRRRVLRSIGAGIAGCALPRLPGAAEAPAHAAVDLCRTPARFDQPLAIPAASGLLGYLPVTRGGVRLSARMESAGGACAFHASAGERSWINPTLVARTGDDARITLANALDEPTVVHWHGLTIDTRNDGNGETLVAPGASFDYRFQVRNRGGLYWYHPHPHGATASQAHRGLIGLLQIEDPNDDALRRALDVEPGVTEIPLILHDRRAASIARYTASASDLVHGFYGDEPLVNFTARPHLDVGARRYRFRIVNAANARIYRLGLSRDDGSSMPFHLIGTDGGLLERAIGVSSVFLAPAERVDVVVDFSSVAPGGFVLLESAAFDPMHGEIAGGGAPPAPMTHADAGHAATGPGTSGMAGDHVHRSDGSAFSMLQFRVARRVDGSRPLPRQLSTLPPVAQPTADERPLRLGFAKGRWRINDRVYDMGATPIVVARDAVETWLLRNYYTSMPHAMHLHGFQFRVLERQTSPDMLAPLAVDDRGRLATDLGWKDTVLVWPGESVRVAIDFRHPFAGSQIYPFHCHNLEHEDGGMMLRVSVG
jgi:suppressor of ftsI/bilirubin oxidase